jgi:hypothetical protein
MCVVLCLLGGGEWYGVQRCRVHARRHHLPPPGRSSFQTFKLSNFQTFKLLSLQAFNLQTPIFQILKPSKLRALELSNLQTFKPSIRISNSLLNFQTSNLLFKQVYQLPLTSPTPVLVKGEEMRPLSSPFHWPAPITGMDVCARKPIVVTCGADRTVRVRLFKRLWLFIYLYVVYIIYTYI